MRRIESRPGAGRLLCRCLLRRLPSAAALHPPADRTREEMAKADPYIAWLCSATDAGTIRLNLPDVDEPGYLGGYA